MSRSTHLPPRCPFNKKPVSRPVQGPFSSTPAVDNSFYPRHHKSPSQSSILEGQPAWLDDLLNEEDSATRASSHRRSASDSSTLLDDITDSFASLPHLNDKGNSTCKALDSACMYGPNSPRGKGNIIFSENAIVSALSEYVSQSPPEHVDGYITTSGFTSSGSMGESLDMSGELKDTKRHSGQRSRVRKLQYIAELERTVNDLQTLESELAIRVASLLQQRVILSLENSNLKQQMARVRQEKSLVDGQYQHLKKELERLKATLAHNSRGRTYPGTRSSAAATSETKWQMLDLGKLNLN